MIDPRLILRGMVRRFLPSAIVGTSLLALALSAIGRFAPALDQLLLGVVGTSVLATGGATLLMLLLRSHLRPDADIAGRRSAVAGVLSSSLALALLGLSSAAGSLNLALPFIGGRLSVLAMPFGEAIPFLLAPVAAGALVAAGVYFPWLTRRSTTLPQIDGALHRDVGSFGSAPFPSRALSERLPDVELKPKTTHSSLVE